MRMLPVAANGATVIEFTRDEALALRDALPQLPGAAAHMLQRHLAMAHGEIDHQHAAALGHERDPGDIPDRVARLEAAVSRLNATTGCHCPDAPRA